MTGPRVVLAMSDGKGRSDLLDLLRVAPFVRADECEPRVRRHRTEPWVLRDDTREVEPVGGPQYFANPAARLLERAPRGVGAEPGRVRGIGRGHASGPIGHPRYSHAGQNRIREWIMTEAV